MKDAAASVLSTVGVFSLLTPAEIKLLAEHLPRRRARRGQVLFREGDQGNDMYILADGSRRRQHQPARRGDARDRPIRAGGFLRRDVDLRQCTPVGELPALAKSTLYSLSQGAPSPK